MLAKLTSLLRQPRSKELILLLIFSTLMVVLMSFNNCSDVKFAKSSASDEGPIQTGTGGDPDPNPDPSPDPNPDPCYGQNNCNPPGGNNPITYKDTVTITGGTSMIDILLVIDNSGSMKSERTKLGQTLNDLVAKINLELPTADWRICYTTTWVESNSNASQVSRWVDATTTSSSNLKYYSKKYLDKSVTNANDIFNKTMTYFNNVSENGANASGSGNEQGLTAVSNAPFRADNIQDGCFRQGAALATLVVTDEDQKSCGGRCKSPSGSGVADEPSVAYHSLNSYKNSYVALELGDKPSEILKKIQSKYKIFTHNSIVIKNHDSECFQKNEAGLISAGPRPNSTGQCDSSSCPLAFYGIEYEKLSSETGGTVGSVCAQDYTSTLVEIAQGTIDTLDSIALNCAPIEPPTFVYAPVQNTTPTLTGNKVTFAPALSLGTVVEVTYKCNP